MQPREIVIDATVKGSAATNISTDSEKHNSEEKNEKPILQKTPKTSSSYSTYKIGTVFGVVDSTAVTDSKYKIGSTSGNAKYSIGTVYGAVGDGAQVKSMVIKM